jgi:hypothetical protein
MTGSAVSPKSPLTTVAAGSWEPMPTVLWPWACQLLVVDASTAAIDLVSSERRRIRGTVVEVGTPFSIRVTDPTESSTADLRVVADWAASGTRVTLLASQHRRSSWVCLSLGHRRAVLVGVESHLGAEAPIERLDIAADHLEPRPVRSAQFCTPGSDPG